MKRDSLINERHFFLETGAKRIYCVEYVPVAGKSNKAAVILCKPIWGERIRTHRIFTNLGRLLCNEGFDVITCDYFGDGNSAGDSLDLNFYSMTEDIVDLHKHICSKSEIVNFTLIGLRVGANCAIWASKMIGQLRAMILVEPIPDLSNYLMDALRSNISSQMLAHKKVIKNRDALVQDIIEGTPVNVDGFMVGKGMWESFLASSPLNIDTAPNCYSSFVSLQQNGKKTSLPERLINIPHVHYINIQREFSWTAWKTYTSTPPIFMNTVLTETLKCQQQRASGNES